ncbi:histidine phosphatase family protein [Pedobacter sp. P351]|uniref:SixA phosphatase family protein n=1 Tax=Pedobacter superstes TaxID=3133441 RepID=UPI0030B4D759
MKQLLLIRHAKSDWSNSGLSDFERPLNKRGNKDAPVMADRLLNKHLIPQAIISSPALRALTTAKYFAEVFNIDKKEIQKEPAIYEASPNTLLSIVNGLDNKFDFIALFGHNPGITNFAISLCDTNIYDMPTCGVILIEFPFDDWKLISKNTGEEKLYDFPRNEED